MTEDIVTNVLPVLSSNRLVLRMMLDADDAELFDIYGDPLVMRYTDEDPFPHVATVRQMLESVRRLLREGQSLEWAIVLRNSGALIGTCGLHGFDRKARSAQAGCLLLRDAWGHGYMREALGLVMDFAANELRLTLLIADIAPANQRARRLFHHLGFADAQPGILRRPLSIE